jgi:hypothetical protein
MLDFAKIKTACDNSSRITTSVLDEFLLYYVGENEGQIHRIVSKFKAFKEILNKINQEWIRSLTSQLIAFEIFKKGGRAAKIINNTLVQKRPKEELDYLQFQIEHPWKFVFCSIEDYQLNDMYVMKDVLSDENFLIYSPGISKTNEEAGWELPLWFLLIGFNGECYQTYGPLAYFKGVQPFDLFYFAKLIKQDIVFQTDVQDVIVSDPVTFSMIFYTGAEIPVTYHKKDMVVFNRSEYHLKDFEPEKYEKDFIIEKKHPLYMLSLKHWHSYPHFAKCYYHTQKKLFVITSMTKRGYDNLISTLNKYGNEFPANPEILATPAMLSIANKVLDVEIETSPYEKYFLKNPLPNEQKELDKINVFVKNLVDRLNNKQKYDIATLALSAGIDLENAKNIAEHLIKRLDKIPRR